MNKDFIPYELALRLKNLGFDNVPCLAVWYNVPELSDDEYEFFDFHNHFTTNAHYETQYYAQKGYKDGILAPTFSQAFRWFRENGFLISLSSHDKDIHDFYLKWFPNKSILSDTYDTYEEAELACLTKLIEIVESKSK